MRGFSGLACTTLALLLVAACGSEAAEPPAVRAVLESEKQRKPAPMFQLKDRFGHAVKLSDYRGKVLLLNFWATWCGGCKKEIPWFQEFATAFGPRRFSILGISVDEDGWAAVTLPREGESHVRRGASRKINH
jgi:thiol-disulfide isomerase/thioredoxin